MFTIYTPTSYTGSILDEEICSAISNAEGVLMDATLKNASNELFALERSTCTSKKTNTLCLFFYTYAVEAHCMTGNSYLSETQLTALLACIEQKSKTCCDG